MAAGFLSAAAVALMGAVNAVATVAALGVALLWWLLTVRRAGMRAVWFALWWVLGLVLACAWWILPLLMMSQVSPRSWISSSPRARRRNGRR